MSGVNKIILVGHIEEAPSNLLLADNSKGLSFSLVTTEVYHKGNQTVEHKEWHQIIMWDGLAERAQMALSKGALICIEGCIKTRSFIDQQHVKRYLTEIVASSYIKMA